MSAEYAIPLPRLLDAGQPLPRLLARLTEAFALHYELWKGRRWGALLEHSAVLAGLADAALVELGEGARLAPRVHTTLRDRDAALRESFLAIGSAEPSRAQMMREQLVAAYTEDLGAQKAEEHVQMLLEGQAELPSLGTAHAKAHDQEQEMLAQVYAMARTNAANARMIVQVQRCAATTRAKAVELEEVELHPRTDDVAMASNFAEMAEGLWQDGLHEIFDALREDAGVEAVAQLLGALHQRAHTLLDGCGRVLGAFWALLPEGAISAENLEYARTALRLAEAICRSSTVHAYTAFAYASLQASDASRWYGHETKRAATRSFPSIVPEGQKVQIDQLLAESADLDGTLVEVEGSVVALEVTNDPAPPKFSSFLRLAAATGAEVTLRAHMFNLRQNGIATGCYCRVRAHVRHAASWAGEGSPVGLDVDRVALTELRKQSWLDDLTHRVKGIYPLFPDEMNLFHTPPIVPEQES